MNDFHTELQKYCRDYANSYAKDNREKARIAEVKYRENNRKKRADYLKVWQRENRDKIHQYYLNQKKKRGEDEGERNTTLG